MVYQFRILSDENEDFLLDIEVSFDMNLRDMSDFLQEKLGYDRSVISSFFISDAEWEKLQEYTQEDMGIAHDDLEYALCDECDAPLAMVEAKVSDVVKEKFDRLVYVFDPIGERQLYVELLRALKPESGVQYPRVIEFKGEVPKQELPLEL